MIKAVVPEIGCKIIDRAIQVNVGLFVTFVLNCVGLIHLLVSFRLPCAPLGRGVIQEIGTTSC